ncbi:MAG: hypothetical protein MZV70_71925 [Desulfobacterales bacterium]|nr:hypothetical protein [Desulfobacterales bacterium]
MSGEGAIEIDQAFFFPPGGGENAVARFNDGILGGDANLGFRAADSRMVLYGAERVEHDDVRTFPGFLRPHAEHSGQPVVAVNKIIFEAVGRSELLQFPEKVL